VTRNKQYAILLCVVLLAFFLVPAEALAQKITLDLGDTGAASASGPNSITGRIIQLLALVTIIPLAPSILMMTTSFVRIVIVLSLLRTALGLQQTPPNQVLISLALFLTFFIMAPVFQASYQDGIAPLIDGKISEKPEDTPFQVLIPAFMISELKRAFEIGFLVYIPFVIIDMLVASTLMAIGMMMLPPVLISLPFKLIFFVLVDGWYTLSGSLVHSFGTQ